MDVRLAGVRVKLDPGKLVGRGGEAEVYGLAGGRVLKVFKGPDHVDFAGLPGEAAGAARRLDQHQTKLPAFPAGLPEAVVAPLELAHEGTTGRIVGYAMKRIQGAEPLRRLADPAFRAAGFPSAQVVEVFEALRRAVEGLHARGVVIGDFNDLNVLVAGARPWIIDADSFQYGGWPCTVFTDRFVDPRLCDPAAGSPVQVAPYAAPADWYAWHALLMQSLLLVGPWGGVHRPKDPARRLAPGARPLKRVWALDPEVVYPKAARAPSTLPDELLHHLEEVFVRDLRVGPGPRLLAGLAFSPCPRCGLEHARPLCPACRPAHAPAPAPLLTIRGSVERRRLATFEGARVALEAGPDGIRWVEYRGDRYLREDGGPVLVGPADPALGFVIEGTATWVVRDGEAVRIEAGRPGERLAQDGSGPEPALVLAGGRRFWLDGGRLLAASDRAGWGAGAPAAPLDWGRALPGRTRIFGGPAFGLGFYRAGGLTVGFYFDPRRKGLDDRLEVPRLAGEVIEARAALSELRAWLFLALKHGGRTVHRALAWDPAGRLVGSAEAEPGDGGWLGTLPEAAAAGEALLVATDAGVVRVEAAAGALVPLRTFPDTEPFVDAAARLAVAPRGLLVAARSHLDVLRLGGATPGKGGTP